MTSEQEQLYHLKWQAAFCCVAYRVLRPGFPVACLLFTPLYDATWKTPISIVRVDK